MKNVGFYYGSIQAKASGCGVDFVNWEMLPPTKIINAAWNVEDGPISNWFDYSYNGSNGGSVKFLTSKPSGMKQCLGTCDWLWIVLNMRSFGVPVTSYYAFIRGMRSDGTVADSVTINNMIDDGVFILPVGTQNSGLDMTDVCTIEVGVYAITDIEPYIFPYSELYTIAVDRSCCESTGVYFLDPKGGFTFLPMDYQEEITYTSEFTEICRDTSCNDSYYDKMQGSRFNLNSKLKSTVKLRSRLYQKTEEMRNLFKAFKASEYRFMMYNGEPRHMLAEAGSTKVYQHDEYIELFVTLADAQEFKVQSGQ